MPTGVYARKADLKRRQKVYAPELVEQVRALYWDQNLTQEEVAKASGHSVRVIENVMLRNNIPRRPQRQHRAPRTGPDAAGWKGDQATYSALHYRVYVARGLPKHCTECGTTDPTKHYDWANLTGNYADVNDYARMCRKCHVQHDWARKREAA